MDSNSIIWILVAVAGVFLFMRMMKGGGGCCGGGEEEESRPTHQHADHTGHAHHTGSGTSPTGPSTGSQVHAIDPVCGMEVSSTGVHRSQHEGSTRFFCSARCKESYDADPERYEAAMAGTATNGAH